MITATSMDLALTDTSSVATKPPATELATRAADAGLIASLRTLISDGIRGVEWSQNKVAKALGIAPATVSIYMRQGDPDPPPFRANLAKFESMLGDLLANLSTKRDFDVSLFSTSVSESMARWISMVRGTNTIGLYLGEAGLGKSCGIAIYAAANPTSLTIHASPWRKTRDHVIAMLWAQFDTRGWDRKTSRSEWIASHLAGKETVLLVDDSHLLTTSALEYLIYLSEETRTPMVLVGNPRIVAKLRQDAQQSSRAFLKQEVTLRRGHPLNAAVDAILQREVPDHAAALRSMARTVASHPGHLRGLTQRCRAMRELMSQTTEYAADPVTAFEAAHSMSIHCGYDLTD